MAMVSPLNVTLDEKRQIRDALATVAQLSKERKFRKEETIKRLNGEIVELKTKIEDLDHLTMKFHVPDDIQDVPLLSKK
jgi:sulfur carrier protein ThiS